MQAAMPLWMARQTEKPRDVTRFVRVANRILLNEQSSRLLFCKQAALIQRGLRPSFYLSFLMSIFCPEGIFYATSGKSITFDWHASCISKNCAKVVGTYFAYVHRAKVLHNNFFVFILSSATYVHKGRETHPYRSKKPSVKPFYHRTVGLRQSYQPSVL